MAKNEFLPFAIGAGANVTSQTEWAALQALVTGFSSGKASSAQINKALRQSTFIASAMAQFIISKTNADILDNGNIESFVSKFQSALAFQSLSRNNPGADIAEDNNELSFRNNLGLNDTMSTDNYGLWWNAALSSLRIRIGGWNIPNTTGGTGTTVIFPQAFPDACLIVIPVPSTGGASEQIGCQSFTNTQAVIQKGASDTEPRSGKYLAIGY
ncbi:hypothetical protein ACMGGS_12285 [Superficieibacter sp. BNK-5]|uniref:gp53-like domain-containing protein n=1 Tax=Superficieibacter sp. BNK-5 TaxID=3376142 RepID=UPI0039BF8A9E